jgi:hypothetical protein
LLQTSEIEDISEDVSLHALRASSTTRSLKGQGPQTQVDEYEEGEGSKRWTFEQAFYAVMGGFAIENEYADQQNVKHNIRRLVTAEGVFLLTKLGLVPDLRREDIEERSKADIFAKLFVLSQITWFGLQVIGRLASKITVTPLEIHTVIHVGCTILIYLIWWRKPYDVRSPVLLSDRAVKDLGALFNFYEISSKLHARRYTAFEKARVEYWKDRVVRAANNLLDHDPPPDPPVKEAITKAVERYSLCSDGEAVIVKNAEEHILSALAPSALSGIKNLKTRGGFTDDSVNAQSWDFLRESSENFAVKQVWGAWSTDTGHEMSLDKAAHFLFNLLYGGGHLAAWNSSAFPTSLELMLWRYSAIMLVSVPLWGTLWILWWNGVRSKRPALYLIRNGDLDIAVAPLFFTLILAYLFARCYFLIESLISLRLLPAGAYLTVDWTRYIPHVT